jgi:hypothetical protein
MDHSSHMNKFFLFFVLIFLPFFSTAQELGHDVSIIKVVLNSASADQMTQRLKQDALTYLKYAPVPRMAEMDFAFGANREEYDKLNGEGVLYITSLNQDTTEYPIKKVYLKTNASTIELEKIGEINVGVDDKDIRTTFGKNRVDYYYLLPYSFTQTQCKLLIDWSNNRKEFLLSSFPNDNKLDYKVSSLQKKEIDMSFLKIFLQREFNITIKNQYFLLKGCLNY